jgi:hypothetical protein
MKDAKDPATNLPLRPITPVVCTIPDSPKYKNGKPMLYNRRFVSVSGYLTSADFRNDRREDGIARFHVTVDHIVFLGQQPASNTNSFANTLDCECLAKWF